MFGVAQDYFLLSPEKTIMRFQVASLGTRVGAHLVDVVLLFGGILGFVIGIAFLSGVSGADTIGATLIPVLLTAGPFLYFILFEGLWNGQTLGKKAMGIRVRMSDGTPITFQAAVARNLLRTADLFPMTYFTGLIVCMLNPRMQRLGDLVADTVVLHDPRPLPIFKPAPYRIASNPLEDHIGELRGMTLDDYQLLKSLAERFATLTRPVQAQMLNEIWIPIQTRIKVPNLPNVHPIQLVEATVLRYGRIHNLL